MLFYDPTMLVVMPAIILAMYAQFKINSTFAAYDQMQPQKRISGADTARLILKNKGLNDVRVEHIMGNLTDHYDPSSKTVRLSDKVYNSTSISAIAVAAHEVGHAIQHDEGYGPLSMRTAFVPAARIGSTLATPLIFLGFFLASGSGSIGMMLIYAGILLFSLAVLFQLVTLPVEFNASHRAVELLDSIGILTDDENHGAKKVLNAAALTYVASAMTALLTLVRFLLLAERRR